MVEVKGFGDDSICFCRLLWNEDIVVCSNEECLYGRFYILCLFFCDVFILKKWYCFYCFRL